MSLNENESKELITKNFKELKRKKYKELIRKQIGHCQRLGEKAETFTLLVYQVPGDGSFNMSYYLPDGQAFPDLTELIRSRYSGLGASSLKQTSVRTAPPRLVCEQCGSSQLRDPDEIERVARSLAPSPETATPNGSLRTPACSQTSIEITHGGSVSDVNLSTQTVQPMEGKLCSTGPSESRMLGPEEEVLFDNALTASLQKLSLGHNAGE